MCGKLRIWSFLLVVTILMTSLTGCWGGKSKTISNEEVPTLLWYALGDKHADIEMVMGAVNKITQDKIGAKIDLQFLDGGSFQDKMNMMLASNAEFDLCFTSDWVNKFLPNVSKGAYAELNELVDKYAPKLKDALPSYLWEAATVNGKIYAVPNLQVIFSQNALTAFKRYGDKYNFDISEVKKTEDIEPLLEKIKQNEPNVYPYRSGYGTSMWTSPVYEQIEPTTGVVIKKDGPDTKLAVIYHTEEYKHGLRKLNEYFKKGYIRPDVASVMNDTQDLNAKKYGVWQGMWKPGGHAESRAKFGEDLVSVTIEEPYLRANAGVGTMLAVSRTSKNKQLAIKLIELLNTDKELYNLLCFGVEGKHYTKIDEQRIDIIPNSGYTPNSAWQFGNQFNAYYLKGQEVGTWEETERINNSAKKSPILGFVLDVEPIKNEIAQCNAVSKEYSVVQTGSINPDEVYDTYMSKLEEAGQLKILAEVQKQVDAFLAAKE